MSELKSYIAPTTDGTGLADYYLKSEADKVIAELKEIDSKNRSAYYKDLARMAKDVERQKYKRCLDNAWWCRNSSNAYAWSASNLRGWKIAVYYDKKAELYRKWHKRWMKLAEKFKG